MQEELEKKRPIFPFQIILLAKPVIRIRQSPFPLQIFSETPHCISNRQSQTAARRTNGTDLTDLAHGALVLHVVFDAVVWAARAWLAGVDGRE